MTCAGAVNRRRTLVRYTVSPTASTSFTSSRRRTHERRRRPHLPRLRLAHPHRHQRRCGVGRATDVPRGAQHMPFVTILVAIGLYPVVALPFAVVVGRVL